MTPPREERQQSFVMPPDMDAGAIRAEMTGLLPRLRRFAIALTGTVTDGDDLVQDTVERALKNLHQWEVGTRLDNWMFRIARNRFLDIRRAARREGLVMQDVPEEVSNVVAFDGERAAEARLTITALRHALQALPDEQREAVGLVLIDGASYREAADTLGIPIGTLTSRLARARENLASVLLA